MVCLSLKNLEMNSELALNFILPKLLYVLRIWKFPCFNLRDFLVIFLDLFLSFIFSDVLLPNSISPYLFFLWISISGFSLFTLCSFMSATKTLIRFFIISSSIASCVCFIDAYFSPYIFLEYLSFVLKLFLKCSRILHCPFTLQMRS